MSRVQEALKQAQQRETVHEDDKPDFYFTPEAARARYDDDWFPRPQDAGSILSTAAGAIRTHPVRRPETAAVIPWNESATTGGEQYRIIRTRIVQHPAQPRVMVVSSACPGDGKTISAINIAGVLSLRDTTSVLLIDADFRRPSVATALGLPGGPGLSDVLTGTCTLQDAVIQVEQFPTLYVLTAGSQNDNPSELLDSDRWTSLCSVVKKHFSFVVVDAPPVAAVADYELIQVGCGGVILVVRPDYTDRTLLKDAFELIPQSKRLGVIMNCSADWFLWKTDQSYYKEYRRQS